MHLLLILAMLSGDAAPQAAQAAPRVARSSIEAKIRGTSQPLEVELLRRENESDWKEIGHRSLPARERRVRFDELAAGAYQLRLRSAIPTEQLATQIVVGSNDHRRITIAVEPFELTGRITLGGTPLGQGTLLLRHSEFDWRAGITLGADGSYRASLWQRGEYAYSVRADALPTAYSDIFELVGAPPMEFSVDLPDGRIAGVVRDEKSGAPVREAAIALKTNLGQREQNVQTRTDGEGRFAFTGMREGQHTVRVISLAHLEPEPISFAFDETTRFKELDVRLDPGRTIPVAVVDASGTPLRKTMVFAVSEAKLCSRAMTDDDGRTVVAVPADEAATLFIVPSSGAFGVQRIAREHDGSRVKIYLPRATSSLLIKASTTDGNAMSPFSLLMRFNGEIVPPEVAVELAARLGLQLTTSDASEALLENIPSGSYEFWPYRTDEEAASILATGYAFAAPIYVHVRNGENKVAVKFAKR
jgi:hypothetical protein